MSAKEKAIKKTTSVNRYAISKRAQKRNKMVRILIIFMLVAMVIPILSNIVYLFM